MAAGGAGGYSAEGPPGARAVRHPSSVVVVSRLPKEARSGAKIAALDLDGTVVTPKTPKHRKVRPATPDDWLWIKWYGPKAPEGVLAAYALKKLHETGYNVVLFTNQSPRRRPKDWSGERWIDPTRAILESVADSLQAIGVPSLIVAATAYDRYRKPMTGMWEIATAALGRTDKAPVPGDFYCGDAAGRPTDFRQGGHPARSDHAFANNVGIPFCTPEYLFSGEGTSVAPPLTRPRSRSAWPSLDDLARHIAEGARARDVRLIIPVGLPGCGKTSLSVLLAARGFIAVSADDYKRELDFCNAIAEHIKLGHTVVADRTNLTLKHRRDLMLICPWLPPANTIFVDMLEGKVDPLTSKYVPSARVSWHWNCVRAENGGHFVPAVGLARLAKTIEPPGLDETEKGVALIRSPPSIPESDRRFYDNVPGP
jgi:bifunctional polynucleotide phosphatase/kinase